MKNDALETIGINALALPDGCKFTPVSLEIDSDTTLAGWCRIGRTLKLWEGLSTWAIADWVGFAAQKGEAWIGAGEKRTERTNVYDKAEEITKLSRQVIQNAASLGVAFDASRRREALTPAHHVEVMGLVEREQERFLDLAEKQILTVKKLRERVREDKQNKVEPEKPWKYRFAHEAAAFRLNWQDKREHDVDVATILDAIDKAYTRGLRIVFEKYNSK